MTSSNRLLFPALYFTLSTLAIVVNIPGRVNPDTVSMLWQGLNPAELNTWHSPFATFTFVLLSPVFGSPTGALIVQSLLFMLWPAFVLRHLILLNTPAKFALIALWTVICFVFISLAGQVNKDTLQLCFLSLIFFLVHYSIFSSKYLFESNPLVSAVIFALVGIQLIRVSNILFILPSLVICLILLRGKKMWVTSTITLTILLAASFLIPIGLGAKKSTPGNAPIIFDLAGISFFSGTNIFQRLSTDEPLPNKSIETCYTPKQADVFIWGECKDYWGFVSRNSGDLKQVWIASVLSHPLAYLEHRMRFAVHSLSSDGSGNDFIVPSAPYDLATNGASYIDSMPEEMVSDIKIWRPTVAYSPFGFIASFAFTGILGQAWLWCLIIAILGFTFPFLTREKDELIIPFILSSTGLANAIMIIVLSGSDDLRYFLPTWFCALGLIVYFMFFLAGRNLDSNLSPID